MSWIVLVTYTLWLLSEILLNRLVRSSQADQPKKDRQSLALIWVTISVGITAAVILEKNSHLPISNNYSIVWIGISLIWIGMICRALAISSLGRFFTVDVTIRENHQLKTDGMYSVLRHPSYTASLLSFIGFGVSLNHWGSLLLIFIMITAAFIYRIRVEEKALIRHFGDQYLNYRQRTNALIPFIY